MSIATRLNYTPEDLLSSPERGRYELVDGQLVERHLSFDTSMIALVINARLIAHVLANKLGWVAQSDAGLQIFQDSPTKVRFADGVFVSRSRLPIRNPEGHLQVAPDLVIEVISPNDEADDLNIKVREYLNAGVSLVWVVYPKTRSIDIFRPDAHNTQLVEGDTLSGEDIVPGFAMPVAEIFDF